MNIILFLPCLMFLSASLLTGCAFLDVKAQQEKLEAFCFISGSVKTEHKSESSLVVLLGRKEGLDPKKSENWSIFDHYVLHREGHWIFYTSPGVYGLAAFEDTNKDLVYQPGEPFLKVALDNLITCKNKSRITNIALKIPKDGRSLTGRSFDVTKLQARKIHDQMRASLGMLTKAGETASLNDPRFNEQNAKIGLWRPFDFLFESGPGIYFLQKYEAEKIPVLFVHGINGTPRNFASIIENLDREKFQPWVYFYPSGVSLAGLARHLNQTMNKLQSRLDFSKVHIVAHSMGGLVSRSFILKYHVSTRSLNIPIFVTIATPWGGHSAAAEGVKYAPAVVRSWYDLAPGSKFLRELFYTQADARPTPKLLPTGVAHHLIFAFKRNSIAFGESSDQVVAVSSQMRWEAQQDARRLYGFDQSHTGILNSGEVSRLVNKLLTDSK